MKVYSPARGGISFDDPFAPPRDSSVLSFLPGISIIPMRGYAGLPSCPVVSIGSTVREGMLIARSQGAGSANIHSPVPGTVIDSINSKLTEGFWSDALVIRLEGEFERLGRRENVYDWQNLNSFELKKIIAEKGIVEMEGEGRPLCDVFSLFDPAQTPFTLVVRCVFDDPWLAADYCVCRERLEAVAAGCIIAARAGGASKIVIAVTYTENSLAIELKNQIVKWDIPVSIIVVGSKYPQSMKNTLASVLRSYEKRERVYLGPLLILGISTLAAISDAVQLQKPILERYIAVGGSAVRHPQILKVRIGSRLCDVFKECGGFCKKPERVVIGSPLLGREADSLDEPIVKTSYAVFASSGEKYEFFLKKIFGSKKKKAEQSCLSCGECRSVCHVGLDPEDIYKRLKDGRHLYDMIPLVMKCNGCGCCEAVCPSKLPLCKSMVNNAFRGQDV